MMLIKILAAFCVGVAALAGLQTFGMWSLQQHLKSDQAKAGMPPIGKSPDFAKNFDASGFKNAILSTHGRIDTREGQRLGVESAQRRIDLPSAPRRTPYRCRRASIPGSGVSSCPPRLRRRGHRRRLADLAPVDLQQPRRQEAVRRSDLDVDPVVGCIAPAAERAGHAEQRRGPPD